MARTNFPLHAFNRGRISELGLARVDLDRTRLSAEIQTNWMPRVLGSMMLRPGLQYIGTIRNSSTAVLIPFVRSATETALLELTSTAMRIWRNDAVIVRTASTASITNSNFSATALTGWIDIDDAGATSFSFSGGWLGLVGTRYARARRYQTVTSSAGTHGVRVDITRGLVNLRIGSSISTPAGYIYDDLLNEVSLRPGVYSFAITTTGNFTVGLSANTYYQSLVNSVSVESSGDMVIDTTWAAADLQRLRYDQSADVVFTANSSYRPKRIERYGNESWGVADYYPQDGPFRTINVSNVQLSPSALRGNINLFANQAVFKSDHVGALFRITSIGQQVSVTPSAADQWSNSIRVAGVDETRIFQILVTSSTGFSATVRVQRSVGEEGSWANVTNLVWTTTIDSTNDDSLDNQIIFYRIGVGSTYTSGSPACTLTYASGGITGVAEILAIDNSTQAQAQVLSDLGSTAASELWNEGAWSTLRGWPSAVALHEGRLWWAGKSNIWGSVSDGYESFDPDVEGDSGPINRSIGSGGVDNIEWLASLGRLIIGTEAREMQAKTSSLDEPLTPSNFNLRDVSSQGSGNVQVVKLDKRLLFIQRGGTRVMETGLSGDSLDYETADRTLLVPEVGEPSIARMAVQRQPDTRVHCVRASSIGTVALMVSDPAENVAAWIDVASTAANGAIEDVAVLPGTIEDDVYYIVRREINGSTVRYLEKWAQEGQARGGSSNRMADSFEVQNSTATTIVSGLDHLVGSSVIAWGATADLGSYTVSTTGTITLSQSATTVCVGLPYEAWYKSAKLAYAAEAGTALTQRKRVSHIGIIGADIHAQGLQYGPSTNSTELDDLPLLENAATSASTNVVNATYDHETFEFNGVWNTDSRVVLRAVAPRPITILGAVITVDTKEKL